MSVEARSCGLDSRRRLQVEHGQGQDDFALDRTRYCIRKSFLHGTELRRLKVAGGWLRILARIPDKAYLTTTPNAHELFRSLDGFLVAITSG
jgi:hypothetical protein